MKTVDLVDDLYKEQNPGIRHYKSDEDHINHVAELCTMINKHSVMLMELDKAINLIQGLVDKLVADYRDHEGP